MKTIIVALFLVLTVSFCMGAVAEKMTVHYGEITRIIGQSGEDRLPWVVFWRDLSGDNRADRVELRLWSFNTGFSLPVMVFLDNDLDGKCDVLYYAGGDVTVGEVWASETLTLHLHGTDAIGENMRDVHPLTASVEEMEGC